MRVLVVDAGSSSVKLSLIGDGDVTLSERELAAPGAVLTTGELRSATDSERRTRSGTGSCMAASAFGSRC